VPQAEDPSERDAVREIVARYAANFPASEITELAARLLKSEQTRSTWDRLLGEVVACAIYNDVGLAEAERLAVRRVEDSETA
jgi:hypothetical protein